MKLLYLIIILLLAGINSYAGDREIDSIKIVLKKAASDKERLKILKESAEQLQEKDFMSALQLINMGITLSQKTKDKEAESEFYMLAGNIHSNTGNYNTAINYFFKSLNIAEAIKNNRLITTAFNNIGNNYMSLGQFNSAEKYITQSLKICEKTNDSMCIARANNNLGNIAHKQGNAEKALQYYLITLDISEKKNIEMGIAFASNNIGNIYKEMKRYEEALKYYEQGLSIAKKNNDTAKIAFSLNNIGALSFEMKDYDKALREELEALALAEKTRDHRTLVNIYAQLSKTYVQLGRYKDAFEYSEKYAKMVQQVFTENSARQLSEMETKYETEKKQKEIESLNKQRVLQNAVVRKQGYIISIIVAGLLVVILLAFLIYRGYAQKKKANFLLAAQKEEIEKKNASLQAAYEIIEEKNKDITDSINYAQKIQQAILPSTTEIFKTLKESFIFYKPKDVVSGDFYAFSERNGKVIIAAVDCTGHGVPGAFMSMIGNDQLNHIIIEKGITKPSDILTQLNKGIKTALKQSDKPTIEESLVSNVSLNAHLNDEVKQGDEILSKEGKGNESRDGMDIVLCAIGLPLSGGGEWGILEYAGAHRPLYIIKNPIYSEKRGVVELTEIQADKTAIAGHTNENYVFTNHEIKIQKGDTIYLFTDGYSDQFGGDKGKKFMTKKFKELLLTMQDKNMKEQQHILEKTFETWKRSYEQVDDVLVIGVRF